MQKQKEIFSLREIWLRQTTLIGIIIIVAVAVVLFGGLLAYQYFTNPNLKIQNPTTQTADWKTYTNTQYGFELKYPSSWSLFESIQKDSVSLTSPETEKEVAESKFGEGSVDDIEITYCDNINTDCARGGSWLEMKDSYKDIPDLLNDKNSLTQKSNKKLDVKIDGIQGYGATVAGIDAVYEIMLNHNGIFLIGFPQGGEDKLIEKQIISTFKFTK